MRRTAASILIIALGALGAMQSVVEPVFADRIHLVPVYPDPRGPEHRGCYWFRHREFCGRYCYTEVNGYRYCTERERTAYPQGFFWEPADGAYPMKLGAPPRSRRD